MKLVLLLGSLMLLSACGTRQAQSRSTPSAALQNATARLTAQRIPVDPKSNRRDRIRTTYRCHVFGDNWNHDAPTSTPQPFSYVGTINQQTRRAQKCPYIYRIEVVASPASVGSVITVSPSWWKIQERLCIPVGNPLNAKVQCTYGYLGSRAPENAKPYFYRVLSGI